MRHYPEIASQESSGCVDLSEVMRATLSVPSNLSRDACATGALSGQFEERIAFAIAVSARYDDYMVQRSHVVIRPGATRPEAVEIIGVEFMVEGGPSLLPDPQPICADDEIARANQWNLTARVLMCFAIKNPNEL